MFLIGSRPASSAQVAQGLQLEPLYWQNVLRPTQTTVQRPTWFSMIGL